MESIKKNNKNTPEIYTQMEITNIIVGPGDNVRGGGPPMNLEKNKKNDEPKKGEEKNQIHREIVYYEEGSPGPFMVYVEGENIGKHSLLKLAKKIFNLNLENVDRFRVKGRSRIGIQFKNGESANNFVKNKALSNSFKVYIPYNYVTCKGIIRYIDTSFTEEELIQFSDSPFKIKQIQRFNKNVRLEDGKTEKVPLGTVLITFYGVNLPRFIKIYGLPLPITPYIPPITQCFQCYKFGHTKYNCKTKQNTCLNCGKCHETEQMTDCSMRCIHCDSTNHNSLSKQCPEHIRQKKLKKIMTFENISYYDASQRIPKPKYTYDPRDFPSLPQREIPNVITVSQRSIETTSAESTTNKKRTREANEETPKRRRRDSGKGGYDREAHNSMLIHPNSRPPRGERKDPDTSGGTDELDKTMVHTSDHVHPFFNHSPIYDSKEVYTLYNKLCSIEKNKIKNLILTQEDNVTMNNYNEEYNTSEINLN